MKKNPDESGLKCNSKYENMGKIPNDNCSANNGKYVLLKQIFITINPFLKFNVTVQPLRHEGTKNHIITFKDVIEIS